MENNNITDVENDLTAKVQELKKLKEELKPLINSERIKAQDIILKTVQEFEQTTSLKVRSIETVRAPGFGSKGGIILFELITD